MDRPGDSSTSLGRILGYLSVGRDITARKLAERQLAESERRLKLALEAGRQGVWELDFRTRLDRDRSRTGRAAAPAARRLRARSRVLRPRPIIRTTRTACAKPSTRCSVARPIPIGSRHAVASATAAGCWVLNFGRVAERDSSGRPLRMVGTTIDINQRKQAELHLRDREQRLRLALEAGEPRRLGVRSRPPIASTTTRSVCRGWAGVRSGANWSFAETIELIHPRDRAKIRQPVRPAQAWRSGPGADRVPDAPA